MTPTEAINQIESQFGYSPSFRRIVKHFGQVLEERPSDFRSEYQAFVSLPVRLARLGERLLRHGDKNSFRTLVELSAILDEESKRRKERATLTYTAPAPLG